MFGRLPETIDPIALAEQGAALAGKLPLRTMQRLASIVVSDPGEGMASVELVFTQAADGVRFLRAKINAELGLACQRCLQPMQVQVRSEPVLALFLPGESQVGVPEEAEALVVEAGWSLAQLVEDELLLAMPMMPRHNPQECQATPLPPSKAVRSAAVSDRPNPFAVLEKLRKRH